MKHMTEDEFFAQAAVSRETERLRGIWVSPRNLAQAEAERVLGKAIDHEYNLADLLRRPDVSYTALMGLSDGKYANPILLERDDFVTAVVEQVEIAAKYSGYIDRQRDEVERAAEARGVAGREQMLGSRGSGLPRAAHLLRD